MGNDHFIQMPTDLGLLADSEAFHEPIALGDSDRSVLIQQLRTMALIRMAEEKIASEVRSGAIRCPCHLAIGQEAIPVAMSQSLRVTDRVFGTHRSHGHFLAQGGTVAELFAEVLGKATGCSRGFGGSMHLYKESTGFWGSVPIVAATVSLAVGAALAAKMEKKGNVAVTYFGDGAMEEGSVHESLNLAAVYNTPVIFVVENNLFSSHLHIGLRQAHNSVARYAAAHGLRWAVVDGNDPVALHKTSSDFVERARRGEGPAFIEAVTYRWCGHVGPSEDIDVGVKRKDDLQKWKRRDPIRRTLDSLEKEGSLRLDQWAQTLESLKVEIDSAWKAAVAAPYPDAELLLNTVYAHGGENRV
jgi:TPP-dependent pyruvate/acetoin dehydrogenase alpha subunit